MRSRVSTLITGMLRTGGRKGNRHAQRGSTMCPVHMLPGRVPRQTQARVIFGEMNSRVSYLLTSPCGDDNDPAQQGARANDHGCHVSCSEQHETRQPRSWLILNVGQNMMRKSIHLLLLFLSIVPSAICADASKAAKAVDLWPSEAEMAALRESFQIAWSQFEAACLKGDP